MRNRANLLIQVGQPLRDLIMKAPLCRPHSDAAYAKAQPLPTPRSLRADKRRCRAFDAQETRNEQVERHSALLPAPYKASLLRPLDDAAYARAQPLPKPRPIRADKRLCYPRGASATRNGQKDIHPALP